MPTLQTGFWQQEQNTKYPALTHWLSQRVLLSAANVTQTVAAPIYGANPAQAVFPGIQPTGEPQQGRRFFVTQLVLRDQNGNLSGAGATAGGTVALLDATTGVTIATVTSPAAATAPPYVVAPITTGLGVINPNDAISFVYTAPTGATATATGFTVDVMGYWQQGV